MSAPATCAAADCDNPVARRIGRAGRPPIYCSPTCRPSRVSRPAQLSVEIDLDDRDDLRDTLRTWVVRLRHGDRSVVVGHDLGRFAAMVLCEDLHRLLAPRARQKGGAID